MQLKRLALTQVRGFERAEFTFQPGMNVLVGVNGAGKSTVLEALRILLSQLLPKFTPSRSRPDEFEKTDIRVGRLALTAELWFEVAGTEFDYLVHIPREDFQIDASREGEVRDQSYIFSERHELTPDGPTSEEILKSDSTAPVAVYFSTRRTLTNMITPNTSSTVRGQALAYAEALGHRELRLLGFARWWLVQEALGKESGRSHFGERMEVLNDAVCRFLDGCSNLRAVREPEITMLIDKMDGPLDVRQLSDGERGLLSLVLDLARRLAHANPGLDNPLLEGKAIVLIDELDLHLHPGWQRDVVHKLVKTFPKCQFIVTTHSPQIIGEVPPEQIILLENGKVITTDRSLGMDANWILEFLMGTAPRNPATEQKLETISDLLEDEQFDLAEEKINELRAQIGEFPELVRLQTRLDRMRILGV